MRDGALDSKVGSQKETGVIVEEKERGLGLGRKEGGRRRRAEDGGHFRCGPGVSSTSSASSLPLLPKVE